MENIFLYFNLKIKAQLNGLISGKINDQNIT